MKNNVLKGLATAACLLAASSSYASLVLVAPKNFSGSGLGAVNTILTVQANGNATTETGGVSFDGTQDVIAKNDDTKTGNAQTQTRTISELGITSALSLRVVFNAVENRGNGEQSISLDNLVLNIYSSNGTPLFTSGAFSTVFFPDTFSGTGNSGYVFALDETQAAAAQLAAFQGSFNTNRIGLSAAASLAGCGNETFFVSNSPSVVITPPASIPPASVPEPGTVALDLA